MVCAPARAVAFAIASPIPRLAPTMNALLPEREKGFVLDMSNQFTGNRTLIRGPGGSMPNHLSKMMSKVVVPACLTFS